MAFHKNIRLTVKGALLRSQQMHPLLNKPGFAKRDETQGALMALMFESGDCGRAKVGGEGGGTGEE
jgi:hypothetical protein